MSLDCCIIGGGIIGLSIARELAGRGRSVRVLAREGRRETASWAAAGIFPPVPDPAAVAGDANAVLTAWSDSLHRHWARELVAETRLDNGLFACGGLHVAAAGAGLERLRRDAEVWHAKGVRCEWLEASGLAAVEPALAGAVAAGRVEGGILLPDEMRIRPPRHLEALERSCAGRGVSLSHDSEVTGITVAGGRVNGLEVRSPQGAETVVAGSYVLAAGAWSGPLAESIGLAIDTRPIRGQIALLRLPQQVLGRIVNRGLDYLVPRDDGRILAGSTLEDVGFDRATVPTDIARLLAVAAELVGDLAGATVEKTWAGLRPGSADGLPSIGRVPGKENVIVAAGHFRAGLHQSPGTAVIVADLLEGKSPPLDIGPFAPGRAIGPPGPASTATLVARAAAER
ncbi:MAG: FAD-dependent oxidoreductase [Planctomycetes bacterium]|nr:FAD-dependent oxidoreductase [Planctomycetota bacterium]